MGLVWLYNPQQRRGLTPMLQGSSEFQDMKSINDVINHIKMKRGNVYFNRQAL